MRPDDMPARSRPAAVMAPAYEHRDGYALIDTGAIRANAAVLAAQVAPAGLCAVVKAGGYGHGAPEVARAALDGGATWLAVALVEEGRELRAERIAAPILVLSEPPPAAMDEVVASRLTPTIYTRPGLDALRHAVGRAGGRPPFPVHVKVDTGMHRVGAAPGEAVDLALDVAADPALDLEGFWTHLAVADEVDNPYNTTQLDLYDHALDALAGHGVRPRVRHAANSGGALWHPRARYDLVRCGIALYGLAPDAEGITRPPVPALRPALSLRAGVSYVKEVAAKERVSYGLRYTLAQESVIATVPLGYADGVPRVLSAVGGEVLVGGRRCPIAGTVTMDQIMVDCGPGAEVRSGDEVVLIGRQGDQTITAWDWAVAAGTIAYEVVCGISSRVPRVYDHTWPGPPAGS
ncbi:MAG: alanine racemase [Acidimicrobiales bacterium]|nr:alanine racemase [Acidimicrobiales bacterium]